MNSRYSKIAIIGAGPAGISAGIQLTRYGYYPAIFEKDIPGGLLKNASLVENFPGIPALKGMNFIRLLEKQVENFELEIFKAEITNIEHSERGFKLYFDGGTAKFDYLIVASGTIPVKPDLQIPDDIADRVFFEPSQMNIKSPARIAIVGGGDAAFDYALGLDTINQITILIRGDETKCLDLLKNRVNRRENIEYRLNTKVMRIDSNADGLSIKAVSGADNIELTADYVLIAIGRSPNDTILDKSIMDNISQLTERGFLYLIGDINNGIYRQAAIACGDGIRAAMMLHDKIRKQN